MAFKQTVYNYLTPAQRLARGVWPWEEGTRSRFPDHFKKRYLDLHQKKPVPVHWRPDPRKWEVDEFGVRTRVDNLPIPIIFPSISEKGLWGGEGFIQGMRQKGDDQCKPPIPRIWKPMTQKRVFYSEILDKYFAIQVTFSTLDLIDKCYGLDSYILKTDQVDLKSKLGMRMKADMIRTLIHKSMYPNDKEKREHIYEKYKEFIVPEEELEWYGLDILEAERKQEAIEAQQRESQIKPLKLQYMSELVQNIKGGKFDDPSLEGGLLSKLNPFKPKVQEKSDS